MVGIRFILLIAIYLLMQSSYAVNVQTVPSVIVKHNNSKKTLSTKTAITTITAKQIRHSGAQTLVDLLKTIPSVQVSQLNGQGGSVTVSMRGFGDNANSNTLILIDGQPLTNPDIAAPNLNIIPLSTIEEIKIMPISESVLYGDQAVGGVIKITTKPHGKRHYQVAADYGSFNTINGEVNLTDKLTKCLNYNFFARVLNTDNYRKHNDYRDNVINGELIYKKNLINAYINFEHTNTHLLFPGALTADETRRNRRQASNNTDFNDQNINKILWGIENNINQNWRFKINSSLNNMLGKGVLTTKYNEQRKIGQLHPALLGTINIFNNSLFLNTGFDFQDSSYYFKNSNYNSDASQLKNAFYGQVKLPINPKLLFTAGARTAYAKLNLHSINNKQSNHATVGSLMAAYQFNHNLQFYARRAGSYRFPKSDESVWSYQNKPLKTQTGVSYMLGTTWKSKNLNTDINIYRLNLRNEILFIPFVNSKYFGYNENLPPTRRNGLQLNINYPILTEWKLTTGYSYIDAIFSSGYNRGKQIPFVAHNQFALANYFYFNKHCNILLEGIYTGSRYPASDIENISSKLNAFTVFNFAINYNVKWWEITLRVNNFTNKHYNDYALYSYGNKGLTTYYYPAPGINAMLNLTAKI
jgi:iron complex outermembrane receptor protein